MCALTEPQLVLPIWEQNAAFCFSLKGGGLGGGGGSGVSSDWVMLGGRGVGSDPDLQRRHIPGKASGGDAQRLLLCNRAWMGVKEGAGGGQGG